MSANIIVPGKESIVASLTSAITTALGSVGDLDDFVDAFSETLNEMWGDASDVEDALQLNNAVGFFAEALAGVFGVFKQTPRFATAVVTFTGDVGTFVEAGNLVATVQDVIPPPSVYGGQTGPSSGIGTPIWEALDEAKAKDIYETVSDVELIAVRVVVPETNDNLDVGELFTIDDSNGDGYVFQCLTAGDLGATNVLGMLTAIPGDDLKATGTATYRTVGRGTGAVNVGVIASESSSIAAPVGAFADLAAQNDSDDPVSVLDGICLIQTPVSGLQNVLNLEVGIGGRDGETDAELLARMLIDIAHDAQNQSGRATTAPSTDPIRGIASALRRITGVIDAIVWDTVGNIHAVVLGGSDEDVANMLHDMIPTGIRTATSGNGILTTYDVKLLSGLYRRMVFERPIPVSISVDAVVSVNKRTSPGEDAILEAIESLSLNRTERPVTERFQFGQDVTAYDIVCAIREITGVLNAHIRVNGDLSVAVGQYQYGSLDSVTLSIIE